MVYCHCNSGSRRDAEEVLYHLLPKGITVFAFDFAVGAAALLCLHSMSWGVLLLLLCVCIRFRGGCSVSDANSLSLLRPLPGCQSEIPGCQSTNPSLDV